MKRATGSLGRMAVLCVAPAMLAGLVVCTTTPTRHASADQSGADAAIALGGYVALVPSRALDTRTGVGGHVGPVGPEQAIELQVTGVAGVPANATAVMLNLTGTEPTAPTYVTVWPANEPRPTASNLNLRAGETRPNAVAIGLGDGGRLALFNSAGRTHLIVDITGYMLPPEERAAGFVSVAPDRLLDTRTGIGAPAQKVNDGSSITVQIGGRAGVPIGARAAVLNVTATEATGTGYVTVWPSDQERPDASSLNVVAGQTVPNLVVATLAPDGTASMFHYGGSVHLIADVLGYFSDTVVAAAGRFVPVTPTRVEDTRINRFPALDPSFGAVSHDTAVEVWLTDASRNPVGDVDLPDDVSAVVINVTAVGATGTGYLTAHPEGDRPPTSTLNVVPGDVVPNLAVVPITNPQNPRIDVYNFGGRLDVLVDVVGYIRDDARAGGAVESGAWWTESADLQGDGSLVIGAIRGNVPLVIRCADRSCAQRSVVELTEVVATGQGISVSVRIAPDGLARLIVQRGMAAQVNAPTTRSWFIRCLDVTCAQRTANTLDGSARLAFDSGGTPVLLRTLQTWSSNFFPVRVDRCADAACASLGGGSVIEPNDDALNPRFAGAQFAIDATDRPVLLFAGQPLGGPFTHALVYLRCRDAVCSAYDETPLGGPPADYPDEAPLSGAPLTLTFDASGRPIATWNSALIFPHPLNGWVSLGARTRIIRCADATCATSTDHAVRASKVFGMRASTATFTSDGTAVFAGWETLDVNAVVGAERPRLFSCLDPNCAATASAALPSDTTIDNWEIIADPAGGLWFIQEHPDGLHIDHLGHL